MSFICYYFHWSEAEAAGLEHVQRRRLCEEISRINKDLNPSDTKNEKSIFEMKGRRG